MGTLGAGGKNSSGFSMIEVMIAGGLIAFIAVALLPAAFSLLDTSKATGFRGQCMAAVRAKLQEYNNGVADNSISSNYHPTGFEYTKKRFRENGFSTCSLSPTAGSPGFREAVFGNTVLTQTQAETVPGTTNTPAVTKGFQLWVMLRHYNPRKLQSSGTYSATGQPSRVCPSIADYQFYGLGDGIEVTVTGMVRTSTTVGAGGTNGTKVGKLLDLNSTTPNPMLTCSATEVVFPPRIPFRYFLARDGRIRNYQAAIAFGAGIPNASIEAMESHFRSVWVQSNASSNNIDSATVLPNIRSFAVAPNNKWVYILRSGELSRYGPCYDDGTSVTVNSVATSIGGDVNIKSSVNTTGTTFKGTPDCPALPSIATSGSPDNQRWPMDPQIENIAVSFGTNLDDPSDDVIYGIFNTMMTKSGGSGSGILSATVPASATSLSWSEASGFSLPTNRPRIRGIYIAQSFPATSAPNLLFFDNTCYTGGVTTGAAFGFCVSIFSSGDTNQQQDVRELPLQVEGISQ